MKKIENHYFEIVIVGGGMSGLCAALAAARKGVRTALIHARPVLGGNASGEIRIHINSSTDGMRKPDLEETGILYELMLTNKARNPLFNYDLWDMTLYEAAKSQENLTLFLNTVMVDAEKEGDSITRIFCYQETTEKHLYFTAPLFVDATGNGTLGYFVDAEYRTGSESKAEFNEPHAPEQPNNERMGNTILFRAIDVGHPVPFTPPSFAKKLTEEDLRLRIHSNRHRPDFSMAENPEDYARVSTTSSSCSDYGYWWLELMGEGDDIISEYEDIRDELFAYFYGIWDHIKNGGDHGAENYELIWVGTLPGTRDSRRLVGDYILNENDIWDNRRFEDAVCLGGWGVDLHVARGMKDPDKLPSQVWNYDGHYTIPYRSYYSKNINNLFMAGRDISCSKLGMASTRIIGTCAMGGQAVGVAAALCRKYDCAPRELMQHIDELQQDLLKEDVFLPGIVNHDPSDLARKAKITATSHKDEDFADKVVDGYSRHFDGKRHSWHSNGIRPEGETLTLAWDEAKELTQLRLTFCSDFRYPIRITMAPARQKQQRPGTPAEIVKDYVIKFYKNSKCVYTQEVKNNVQRLNVLNFKKIRCDKVEITFLETHGCKDIEIFEIRAY